MLCQSQENTDEPCADGMSRRIRCLLGMDNSCMKNCNPRRCPAFEALKRDAPARALSSSVGGAVFSNGVDTPQDGCGGCGVVKELSSENKFI